LLREHVQRVPGDHGRLNLSGPHPLRDDRALEQVGPELGEDAATADVADRMTRPPDSLETPRHGLRRLDLDDEVDRAHVDPELQGRRRHQARQLAGLQHLLDHESLLAREGSVGGAGDLVLGQLIQSQRQPLGGAPVVDEQDRRPVRLNELEQLGVDRGPDRPTRRLGTADERVEVGRGSRVRLDHRVDRDLDLEVELLADSGVDDSTLAGWSDHEAGDLLERLLRRRQSDPLDLPSGRRRQPLERQCQMGAPLGRRHRVDLVDDARLGAGEQLLRSTGEHQIQRFGRGDEDVRRLAEHRLALALRCIPGPHRDTQVRPDAAQGHPKVAVDVVGERLQRRDIDQPDAPRAGGDVVSGWLAGQPVDRPQKRSQRLPRPRRGRDQDVVTRGDRRPRLGLCRRRLGERAGKPLARAWRELLERHSAERSDPATAFSAI
jgi:hypothetical protein